MDQRPNLQNELGRESSVCYASMGTRVQFPSTHLKLGRWYISVLCTFLGQGHNKYLQTPHPSPPQFSPWLFILLTDFFFHSSISNFFLHTMIVISKLSMPRFSSMCFFIYILLSARWCPVVFKKIFAEQALWHLGLQITSSLSRQTTAPKNIIVLTRTAWPWLT